MNKNLSSYAYKYNINNIVNYLGGYKILTSGPWVMCMGYGTSVSRGKISLAGNVLTFFIPNIVFLECSAV